MTIATVVLASVVAAGCTPDGPDDVGAPDDTPATTVATARTDPPSTSVFTPRPPTGPFGTSALSFFDDCAALADHMKAIALERVTPWGLGGGGWWGGPMFAEDEMAGADGDAAEAPTAAPVPTTTAPDTYSTTNTQEVGVDEGDIVETDGRHVYLVTSGAVRIVEVESARLVASPELPNGNHQMILDGSRLLVSTQGWYSGASTIVSIFDVSTPSSPVLLRRSHLEGRMVASRSIDGMVRLVLASTFDERLNFVWPDRFGFDEAAALAENRAVIERSTAQDWLPRTFDEAGDGTFGPMREALDCSEVAAPPAFSGLGVSWIATIDLRGDLVADGSAGVVSQGETVYAAPGSLYVATVPWDDRFGWSPVWDGDAAIDPAPAADPVTMIHGFVLDAAGGAEYQASGEVPGVLLNQFAMSEYDGVLRVATTTDQWDDRRSESAVYALENRSGVFEVVSVVGGLGRGERIHAVRFMGPTAYVVTFRQIDPLYVIDLSDPTAPVLQGELKIPGYSAYLHPVGEGLLLGVGQDATDTGMALGTQLSLFDVSDPTAPERIDTLPIGGWSDVEWDHRAFLFWPADGTIVLPVSPGWGDCGRSLDGDVVESCLASGITSSAGGAVVARLDGRSLTGVGVIDHARSDSSFSGCWNPLQRSVVLGSELATIGTDQIRFSDRASLVERATVTWADDGDCTWWWD